MSKFIFPPGFDFGVATSAYQIEGAWNEDGKGPSIWDKFSQTPGKVHNDVSGNRGVDHYHRYRDDIAIMKELGIASYRMSIGWSRVLPNGMGQVNQAGVDFYSKLVDRLLEAGIQPNVTLYHWDLPQALEDRGGWANRDVADWFGDYASLMFEKLGDRVNRWATLNEPIAIWVGYGMGLFAPGHADPKKGRNAMHNGLRAHGKGVQAFRAAGSPGDIGVVVDIWKRHPATDSADDQKFADEEDDKGFRFFLDPLLTGRYGPRLTALLESDGTMPDVKEGDLELIASPIDYFGINVYSRVVVSAEHKGSKWWEVGDWHPGGNFLDNGLELYPKAVYDAIKMVEDEYGFKKPIFITENGMAERQSANGSLQDSDRIRYVDAFLQWIGKAILEGSDVRGYYLWSLMDNYEWTAGYSTRFGIVHVDPDTMTRTWKDSAHWYRDMIANRSVALPE